MRWLTLTEFLALPHRDPEWLVEGLIPCQTSVLLGGLPESGKTILCYQLALAVAQGTAFLGRSTKQGAVLLVEVNAPEPSTRLQLVTARSAGIALHGPVYVAQPDELVAAFPYSILLKKTQDWLSEAVTTLRDTVTKELITPVLVIVDALRDIATGDENSSKDMYPVMTTLLHLFPKQAVVVVHHANKLQFNPAKPPPKINPILAISGNTAITARPDTVWLLHEGRLYTAGRFGPGLEIPLTRGAAGWWSLEKTTGTKQT